MDIGGLLGVPASDRQEETTAPTPTHTHTHTHTIRLSSYSDRPELQKHGAARGQHSPHRWSPTCLMTRCSSCPFVSPSWKGMLC